MDHLRTASSPTTTRGRRPLFLRSRTSPAARGLGTAERARIPRGFEAVAESLAAGGDPAASATEAGRALAADGASLGEALSALRTVHEVLGLGEPGFTVTEHVATAWSEATLAYLGEVSCEDPLTGLASTPHLRARLDEVYRTALLDGTSVRTTHALLVADLGSVLTQAPPGGPDPFAHALSLAGVAEAVRGVFPGEETLARAGRDKVVALVRRTAHLGATVVELRAVLEDLGYAATRIWLEALPEDPGLAAQTLAGLSRLGR